MLFNRLNANQNESKALFETNLYFRSSMEMSGKSEPMCAIASQQPKTKRSHEKVSSESVVSQRITIAGGFLDIALFVADVEHLKFIFDTGKDDIDYYNLLVGLLFTSLALQVMLERVALRLTRVSQIAVGVLLFIVGFSKSGEQTLREAKWTKIVNHLIIGMVSLIAVIEIFVTKFGDRGESIVQYSQRHDCRAGGHSGRNATHI